MPHLAQLVRPTWTALLLLGVSALPRIAEARPVTADDFKIYYRFTDGEGKSTTTELTPNDLNYYVNRARCQCGEEIAARVALQRSTTGPYDAQAIRTFVGSQCGQGQDAFGPMNRPCVKFHDGQPTEYDDGGIDIIFQEVWLSSRVESLADQSPETAPPVNPCLDTQTGEAGIWICVEDGMQTDCQSSEFIIQGTQSQNANNSNTNTGSTGTGTGTSTGTTSSGGIVFDYLPPQATVTGFAASPGDGAVEIRWDRSESTQINGYRVLCADIEGNPVPGKGATLPVRSQRTNGKLYYTAENLCPDAVVFEGDTTTTPTLPTDDGGTDGSDSGTSTGVGLDLMEDSWLLATGTGSTGGATDTGTGTATGAMDTDGTSSTDGSSGGTTGDETTGGSSLADSPLASLDWAYVCSDHITGTGTSARVDGLENGKTYQFIVVAYDRAGNPLIVSGDEVMLETPEETLDFWEQCERQGDLCGNGGFCQCRSGADTGAAWLGSGLLLLAMLGLRRRGRA
ncbi:MAG: hypothetical protein H6712_05165 [Myxococcales bacterium]|nr:hypothetical protein [Myxococcales bacterium]MCB9713222.1 hypothetical protein [Myxococcales bacterium]